MIKRSVDKNQNRSMSQSRQSVFDSEYLGGQRNLAKLQATIRSEWKIDHPNPQHNSQILNHASSGIQFSYKKKFEDNYGNINSQFMSQKQLEDSLSEMRSLLKLMNDFINSKVSNTYKYLAKAAVQQQPVDQQKQYEVLKARYQNNQQRLEIQKNDIQHLTELLYSLGDPETILDDIQGQINDTNRNLKQNQKENKETAIDVQKLDNVLYQQEGVVKQQSQFYIFYKKLKILWQYQTQKVFQGEEHQKKLDSNMEDLKYKLDEISDKLAQYKKIAQEKSLEVSTNPNFIHLKEKYIQLQKTRTNCKRKNQLTAKNLEHNLFVLTKNLNQSKKHLEIYNKKIQQIHKQIQSAVEVISRLSSNEKFTDNFIKNISEKYSIENYLHKPAEKKENSTNARGNFIANNQKSSLRSRVIKRQAKSQHKQQFSHSMVVENNNIQLALEQEILATPNNKKPLFRLGKPTPKINESMSFTEELSKQKQLTYAQSEQQISKKKPPTPQKIISSKPSLRINRRDRDHLDTPLNKTQDVIAKIQQSIQQVPNLKPSRFGRLNQRKKGQNQISQQYMKTLQQRGRKILGL